MGVKDIEFDIGTVTPVVGKSDRPIVGGVDTLADPLSEAKLVCDNSRASGEEVMVGKILRLL